jgi:hypothetical protein
MDEQIEIDLNGKAMLPLRLVRAAMVAQTGWSDQLAAANTSGLLTLTASRRPISGRSTPPT